MSAAADLARALKACVAADWTMPEAIDTDYADERHVTHPTVPPARRSNNAD